MLLRGLQADSSNFLPCGFGNCTSDKISLFPQTRKKRQTRMDDHESVHLNLPKREKRDWNHSTDSSFVLFVELSFSRVNQYGITPASYSSRTRTEPKYPFSRVAPRLKRFNKKSLFKTRSSVLVLTNQQVKPIAMFMPFFSVSWTAMMYHELNTATGLSTYA
jgi:hypothetical protein